MAVSTELALRVAQVDNGLRLEVAPLRVKETLIDCDATFDALEASRLTLARMREFLRALWLGFGLRLRFGQLPWGSPKPTEFCQGHPMEM